MIPLSGGSLSLRRTALTIALISFRKNPSIWMHLQLNRGLRNCEALKNVEREIAFRFKPYDTQSSCDKTPKPDVDTPCLSPINSIDKNFEQRGTQVSLSHEILTKKKKCPEAVMKLASWAVSRPVLRAYEVIFATAI